MAASKSGNESFFLVQKNFKNKFPDFEAFFLKVAFSFRH